MRSTRREFLRTTTVTGSLAAWGMGVPAFLSRTAAAAREAGQPGARDTILVVVELSGGNDGLNTVVPFKDPAYARYRPTLKLPSAQLRKVNDEIALHPQMTGLSELLEKGELAIIQGVGYPNPSQSHFRSMDIWQAASLADTLSEGWLGKALKQMPSAPAFHLKGANESAPLAVEGAPVKVPSLSTLEDFQLQLAASSGADKKSQREIIEEAARTRSSQGAGLLDFVQRTAANTYASSRRLQEIGRSYQPRVPYPNTTLAGKLRLAAQLIDAGIGARLFYVSIGGFDTHSTQAQAHANLLGQVSAAMTAFYRDISARGHGERVLMMTFSEFGRRPRENGSRGTDHGTAAPMLLVGSRVQAGLLGKHPSLDDLAFGNLKHHTDFRQVYATLLDGWLGVSSKEVLGQTFTPLPVLKS